MAPSHYHAHLLNQKIKHWSWKDSYLSIINYLKWGKGPRCISNIQIYMGQSGRGFAKTSKLKTWSTQKNFAFPKMSKTEEGLLPGNSKESIWTLCTGMEAFFWLLNPENWKDPKTGREMDIVWTGPLLQWPGVPDEAQRLGSSPVKGKVHHIWPSIILWNLP
jgi:hypothetical protein